MGYFDALSYLDFEELVADLMTAATGVRFRAGASGPDAGVDVLAETRYGLHVIQCKHYRTSTYPQLRSAVRREADGLTARAACFASYRLTTSRHLTHAQRAELAQLLAPWLRGPQDVLGESDLRALLREHPEVEQRHVKLWIASAGALRRALGVRSYQRSAALLADIEALLPRYVQTDAFRHARALLERESACVIAGSPGIGKTTLARMLVLDALESGHRPYEIVPGALADAWDMLELDEPQVYLFDDFLGQTFLEPDRVGDRDLMRFLRAVVRRPGKRIVLTTREYILQDARLVSEVLAREIDPAHRFVLQLPALSRRDRARILYNHVWSSAQVDEVARAALLRDRGYLAVIDHESFNPRVVEWMCELGVHRLSDAERADFTRHCLRALSHPAELWTHAFEQGIGEAERALLLALPGLPARVALPVLEEAFDASCQARGVDPRGGRFTKALRMLTDSFLASHRVGRTIVVSAANPSLLDFLREQITHSRHDARTAIEGAAFFEQVVWLFEVLMRPGSHRWGFEAELAMAFERTFTSPTLERRDTWDFIDLRVREDLESACDRFAALLRRVDSSPALRDACVRWLPGRAQAWLATVSRPELLRAIWIGPVDGLIRFGALEPEAVARRALRLLASEEHPYAELRRFELLIEAHELAPSVVAPELARHRELFIRFAAVALERLGLFLDDLEDVADLERIADAMGVALPQDGLDDARERFREDEDDDKEASVPHEPTTSVDPAEPGPVDPTIDALFRRLTF